MVRPVPINHLWIKREKKPSKKTKGLQESSEQADPNTIEGGGNSQAVNEAEGNKEGEESQQNNDAKSIVTTHLSGRDGQKAEPSLPHLFSSSDVRSFNVRTFKKLRLPYKLVISDLSHRDYILGVMVGSDLMRIVDFLHQNEDLWKNKKNSSNSENTGNFGERKARDAGNDFGGQVPSPNGLADRLIGSFSLDKPQKYYNAYQRRAIEVEAHREQEEKLRMERLAKRQKQLHLLLKSTKKSNVENLDQPQEVNKTTKNLKSESVGGMLRTPEYLAELKVRASDIRKKRELKASEVKKEQRSQSIKLRMKRRKDFSEFNQSKLKEYQRSFELISQTRRKEEQRIKKMRQNNLFHAYGTSRKEVSSKSLDPKLRKR